MNVYDIDDCFLEYSGNPDKNQEFKEILDDVGALMEHFMERIVRLSKYEQKIYDTILACDKKGKIDKKHAAADKFEIFGPMHGFLDILRECILYTYYIAIGQFFYLSNLFRKVFGKNLLNNKEVIE